MRLSNRNIFLSLLLFILVLNIPYFSNIIFYVHDTFFSFVIFTVMYTDFFHNFELTQWLPFTTFGTQNGFPPLLISASNYFMGLVGGLIGIESAQALFKASIIIEETIFLAGIFLFCRDLFKSRAAVAFACLSALGSIVLTVQIVFNFRAFAFLPLIFWFIRRFFDRKGPYNLAIAFNLIFLSVPGATPYCLQIIALQSLIFFAVLLAHNFKGLPESLRMRGAGLIATAGLTASGLVIAASFLYAAFHMNDLTRVYTEMRNPETLKVPLKTFLTYGGEIGAGKFMELLIPQLGDIDGEGLFDIGKDLTLFIGLLPLPFVLYGLASGWKDPVVRALGIVAAVMGLFSMGGLVSKAVYYLVPGMDYYRHIGLSVGSFKFFLPVLAGYGVDRLLERRLVKWRIALCVAASALVLIGAAIYYQIPVQPHVKNTALVYFIIALVVIAALFACYRRLGPREHVTAFLIIGIAMEMLGYQAVLAAKYSHFGKEVGADFASVERPAYQEMRTLDLPVANKDNYRFLMAIGAVDRALYSFYYNFLQSEPCESNLRIDYMNRYVTEFLEARGAEIRLFYFKLPPDPGLSQAIGCRSPKLKLMTNVLFAESEAEAMEILKYSPRIGDFAVLTGVPEEVRSAWADYPQSGGEIKVEDFRPNGLELTVKVPENEGAWLYYADAYHPSWRAFVNGSPAAIFQANHAFKAVRLFGGESKVSFRFENGNRWAIYITIFGGVAFISLFLVFLARFLAKAD